MDKISTFGWLIAEKQEFKYFQIQNEIADDSSIPEAWDSLSRAQTVEPIRILAIKKGSAVASDCGIPRHSNPRSNATAQRCHASFTNN